MSKHKWTFTTLGNVTRVTIHSGDDIRHLSELDKKMWTVLSCPTTGLEISNDSLQLMDTDGDNILRIPDVLATASWLCANLVKLDSLFLRTDEVTIANIADASLAEIAKQVAAESAETVNLAQVDAAIAAVTIEPQAVPQAPLEANVIAAYKAKSAEYAAYFEQEKLQKMGLAVIAEDAPKPGMTEKKFAEMGAQITEWESAKTAAETANAAALAEAKAKYMPLRKLILLHRDFHRLLCNFVSLEDFYSSKKLKASFQCGTLIIDQRACHLCIRVNDITKHALQAPQSGMYLIYCDCESKKLAKKMQIVAAMTQGDINSLCVGKNAVFYDNDGNDYNATVTKIIDNPISILQAFWTPYRKLGNWVSDKINKSAAEKDAKMMSNMTTKMDAKMTAPAAPAAPAPAFDIAKFAGIFAAVGLAFGMIGTALAQLAAGLSALLWWQLILLFVGIILFISAPSMVMAWMKLRKRNLAPVLNANGWAINANAIISVMFGTTLTDQVKYPIMRDPLAKSKKKMKPWRASLLTIVCLLIIGAGVYGLYRYLHPIVEVDPTAMPEVIVDSTAVIEEGIE